MLQFLGSKIQGQSMTKDPVDRDIHYQYLTLCVEL